jgi:hypothetical protein
MDDRRVLAVHRRRHEQWDVPMRRVWRWISRRPFLAVLVLVVALAVPGYIRQEQAIDEAHRAAVRAEEAIAQLDAEVDRNEQDRMDRRAEFCQRDLEDRRDARAMWVWALIERSGVDGANPVIQEAIAELNDRLPLLECNAEQVPVPIGGS